MHVVEGYWYTAFGSSYIISELARQIKKTISNSSYIAGIVLQNARK